MSCIVCVALICGYTALTLLLYLLECNGFWPLKPLPKKDFLMIRPQEISHPMGSNIRESSSDHLTILPASAQSVFINWWRRCRLINLIWYIAMFYFGLNCIKWFRLVCVLSSVYNPANFPFVISTFSMIGKTDLMSVGYFSYSLWISVHTLNKRRKSRLNLSFNWNL